VRYALADTGQPNRVLACHDNNRCLGCVAHVGEPGIAALMLAGVRVGGSPYWPTRFRWGYGWPWPRGYRAPTPAEHDQIEKALRVGKPGPYK